MQEAVNYRRLPANAGLAWLRSGWALFKRSPVLWVALTLVYFLIYFALALVPLVGAMVSSLLAPLFGAGFMIGARALAHDGELELAHLFAGFRGQAAPLITVGGVLLITQILVSFVVLAQSGAAFEQLMSAPDPDPERARELMNEMMPALFLGMLLWIPAMMLSWFAPALIVFHGLRAVPAMKLSFAAVLANILPFLIYSLVLAVLLVLAAMPFMLGLLLWVPVAIASIYTSYVGIFAPDATAAGPWTG